jgi:type III restriction enzyme
MPSRAKTSTIPAQTELPIQAPVEEPIINSPYVEPKFWWRYEKDGQAVKEAGRRKASYFYTTKKVGTAQETFEFASDTGSDDLPLVNELRKDVARWRASNYENATQTTKKLLAHWQRTDRKRRLFFCQIEAVETVIYLNEILAAGRRTRWNAAVSAADYEKLLKGIKPDIARSMGDDFFPRIGDQPWDKEMKALTRYGCKMATGSGKTVVMSMLIAWAFCNRGAVPGDDRFPQAVLVACPNLTVKERLQVLRPDNADGTYYEQFDIVPSQMRSLLHQGRVLVTNWHGFAPESPHAEAGGNYAVVNKGEEGPDAFSRRVLQDLYGRGAIMVMNDEAHHAYRPAPPEEATKTKRKKNDEGALIETDEDRKEATVWVEGLDKINQAVGIHCCVDLSATPFYLAGSGHIEGSPFPWLVSDFGLVDAIESGITKIPRIPVSDITGRPDPKFFKLWEEIKSRIDPSEMVRGKPKPEAVWREAGPALATLASQWQERFEYFRDAKQGQEFIPPVLIVVGDNTDIAQVFFERISGETTEEAGEEDVEETGKRVKRFNPAGVPFPDLANSEKSAVTLRIDSKLLAEAEAGEGSTKVKEAERLRQIIASVGTKGTPGEHIRCVVSVQMLTEGWDANNVTQILGLRAFGSQLLCEQVVGRGLRRINYDPDPETQMLRPEYVDVYGIPFSVVPFKGRKQDHKEPEDKPVQHVKALPERASMEMRFPNVEGYVMDLKKHSIVCDVAKVGGLEIESMKHPTQVFVQPQVGVKEGSFGTSSFQKEEHTREEFYAKHHFQTILFEIARQVVMRLTDSQLGQEPKLRYHARHLLFPQVISIVELYAGTRIQWNGCDRRELGLQLYAELVMERLTDAIQPDESQGELPLLPIINRFDPYGTTESVSFSTTRPCHVTSKSHIDQVVLDTDTWEKSVSFTMESSSAVKFFARNDHLNFAIPYEFYGVSHNFMPDFLVRLESGVTLILEIKGMMGEKEEAKFEAARRWVTAVNNWGRMGRWAFHVCRDPQMLARELAYLESTSSKASGPKSTGMADWNQTEAADLVLEPK